MGKCNIIIAWLIILLWGCNLKHEQSEVKDNVKFYGFLDKDETRYLLECAIHFSLKNFPTSDFSVYPVFNENLTDDVIRASLKDCVDINALDEMINNYHQNHEDSTKVLLSEQFHIKIGVELNDVLVAVSYPLIDFSNERVYFYSQAFYPYNDGVASDEIFYGFKKKDDEWGLFATIEVMN